MVAPDSSPSQDNDAAAAEQPSGENAGADMARIRQEFDVFVTGEGNNFYFGATAGAPRRRMSGMLHTPDIDQALKHFVQPPGFGDALKVLESERVVVLSGPAGSGRRCGSYALLRRLGMNSIVLLPPSTPLGELTDRPFRTGHAYLAPDVEGLSDPSAEVCWSRCRDKLAETKSYLVITQAPRPGGSTRRATTTVPWQRPSMDSLADVYVRDEESRNQIRALFESASYRNATLEELATFLADVESGSSVEDAADRFDDGARLAIAQWLDKPRTVIELAEVLTAAFFPARLERDFEALHKLLVDTLISGDATAEPKAVSPDAVVTPHRRHRSAAESLIEVRRSNPRVNDMIVTLKHDSARVHLLAEMARRYDREFWDAVATWLGAAVDAVSDESALVVVAESLAVHALESPLEVLETCLDPWADTPATESRQRVAVYTTWWMASSDEVSSLALAAARRWIISGTALQKWTAATCFSGNLGASFPAEALRRIWSVLEMMPTRSAPACAALARLFAFLEDEGAGSHLVVRMLDTELSAHNRPGNAQDIRRAALAAAMDTLSAASGPGRPATWIRLFSRSETTRPAIARVWAALLRSQRYRTPAAAALVAGLKSLEGMTEVQQAAQPTAGELLKLFSDGLMPLLRPSDVAALGMRIAYLMSGKQADGSSALVTALLDRCLTPTSPAEAEI